MSIEIGQKIPDATVFIMGNSGPESHETSQLFTDKKTVLFALPGAFTPTCSRSHLPGYIDHFGDFAQKGVDQVICLSVNDAWVMDAWGKAQGADGKVMMVGDGNGDLSRKLGFLVDKSGAGFGDRSIRYAMIIENGVVTHLNVEEPQEFKISDAGTMLELL